MQCAGGVFWDLHRNLDARAELWRQRHLDRCPQCYVHDLLKRVAIVHPNFTPEQLLDVHYKTFLYCEQEGLEVVDAGDLL
jgi:hypothetical protein